MIISGYYGFDNLGDELILRVLIDELKAHKIEIVVLSQNPKKTAQQYGVEAIKRTSFIDVVDALARANLFISGGGGLFQDATGPMSALYYGGLIHLADFFEVPVCFWAQGVGPLRKKLSRQVTASAMKRCEVITVRDAGSVALVEELTGQRPEMTADPVWMLNTGKKSKPAKHGKYEPWRVGISLRPWPDLTEKRLDALAHALIELAEHHMGPVEFWLLPFQKKEDTHLLANFAKRLQLPDALAQRCKVVHIEPADVLDKVGLCQVIVGMRFHSLILGLLHHIPVYGLIYDPKVAALLDMFQLQGTRIDAMESLDASAMKSYFDHYPTVDLKPMKQQSKRNFQILNELLDIPQGELLI